MDIILGNFSGVLGSAGGFCAGSTSVIDHQRLSSQAYCFSASLPAPLAKCALEALLEIEARPELAARLAANVRDFRQRLIRGLEGGPFVLDGHPESPLMFLKPKGNLDEPSATAIVQQVIERCRSQGLLLSQPASIPAIERLKVPPAIKVTVTAGHTQENIEKASATLISAGKAVKS